VKFSHITNSAIPVVSAYTYCMRGVQVRTCEAPVGVSKTKLEVLA